jgi:hypothetical protein
LWALAEISNSYLSSSSQACTACYWVQGCLDDRAFG